MPYKCILYEKEGELATLTFNRPDVRNALSFASIDEALDAVTAFESDPQARALIVTGAGDRAFVAGADIGELRERNLITELGARSNQRRVLTAKLENMDKPSVAAVNGFALGGGLEIALACTLRLASESARFGLTEINLGIMPGNGGTQRLARLVGLGRALEMVLTGDMVDAQEAYRIGLVSRVLPQDKLIEAARELAKKLAAKPPIALKAAKEAVLASTNLPLAQGMELEKKLFTILCGTADKEEGVAAFLEKRPPQFQGM
ncbi:MAG: enoyl-CoA hydratase/isomerase family protein [Chloroflexi bacterium]|nr:enoyl-CoA hydratase/isomerase family protein [Chloroflexota bacterium]